jgi:tRNA(His) guanylyltransferase
MKDEFGDRMKQFERAETEQKFMPLLPIVVRLDGRSFHSYTSGFERPIDFDFRKAMVETTKVLVEETNATIGYTQSDEITLILYSEDIKSQIWFNGEKFKIVSCLASLCSVTFDRQMQKLKDGKLKDRVPTFDCRAYNVPTKIEAANAVLWRELDCCKNAISMSARCYYSHEELNNKSGSEKQEMLFAKGVNFNDYPAFFKRGTFVQRKRTTRKFTEEEIKVLPLKHQAKNNPDLVIERTDVVEIEMPKFSSVVNRVGVVFDGEEPWTGTE